MICPVCGREYQRKTCEYCAREQKWPDSLQYKNLISTLTPRIQNDLKRIDKEQNAKIAFIYDKICKDESKHSIYIFGGVGAGKTLLSARLLLYHCRKCYIENQIPGNHAFITIPELLQNIRSCYSQESQNNEDELLNKYYNVDWLILDDFGIEKTSEWVLQTLYLIINHRYEYQKITIFTSNLSLDTLSEKLGEERIPSRIAGMSHVIKLKDHDFRIEEEE